MGGDLKLRVGTRGSRLALAQAALVVELISRSLPGAHMEIVPIRTAGDTSRRGGSLATDMKVAFTHEIDRLLLEKKVDIAIHSLKDVPSTIDPALVLAAMPPRGDPRDALVTVSGTKLGTLPRESLVGTSSIRRKVQLGRLRPDLRVVEVRGNVETRMGKMKENGLEGVVLAAAGLQRLGLGGQISEYFTTEDMVPAACQGILGVEARRDEVETLEALRLIDDPTARAAGECERAFLKELGGDCNFPVGAHSDLDRTELTLVGLVAEPDGSSIVRDSITGPVSEATELGSELARRLMKSGAAR